MQRLHRIPLSALFLFLASAVAVHAQDHAPRKVDGQEAIAGVNELPEAVDLLYVYPLNEEELADFYLTMTSLTAWARAHGFEWNGMIDSYPKLEALRGLTYWETVDRSPEPFCTTFAKASLLSNYADPEYDARVRAQEYLDHHRKLFEADEIEEEDIEMVQEGMALALEHLAQLNSIPEENRRLYIRELKKIDAVLADFNLMGLLPAKPETGLLSCAESLRMRATGLWSRSQYDTNSIFELADSNCYVGVYSVPWHEDDILNDALMDEIVAALTDQDLSLDVKDRFPGELNGNPDYRLHFQLNADVSRGLIYATAVEDTLHILIFRFSAEEEGLLKPILDECCANLEFGDYALPLLLDRSEVGYQIFAEDPWVVSEVSPTAADSSLNLGELPLSIDIAILGDIGFELDKFMEVLPALTDLTRDRFIAPLMEETRMMEVDGFPCAVVQGSGILLQDPGNLGAIVQVSTNYYILNGDRIVSLGALGAKDQWNETGPMLESLVLQMKITQIAPSIGPTPILLDQSEDGFMIFAREPWATQYDETYGIWNLTYGDYPFALGVIVYEDPGIDFEKMRGVVQKSQEIDTQSFEDPTVTGIAEFEVDGRTALFYEVYGTPKSQYSSYAGKEEHFLSLFVPLDNQLLRISISGKHESWDESQSVAFELIQGIRFPAKGNTLISYNTETSLLLDRAEVGYQVFANGLWQKNPQTPDSCDRGLLSQDLGCFIDIAIMEGGIPLDRDEDFATYVHNISLEQYVEPHVVDSGTFEIGGRKAAFSEVYGVQAEGNEYAGTNIHLRQIFVHFQQQMIFVSVRTKAEHWEAAKPHIEELLGNMKFPDVSGFTVDKDLPK